MDTVLQDLWAAFAGALVAGDKETALTLLTSGAQQTYAPVFDILAQQMPDIVASFSALQSVTVTSGLGEYAINRTISGRDRIFLIYFVRGFDGVWHLAAM